MKMLIIATTLTLALALPGASMAMNPPLPMSDGTRAALMRLVPEADLSRMTPSQASRIAYLLVNSGREYTNPLDKQAAIRLILKGG